MSFRIRVTGVAGGQNYGPIARWLAHADVDAHNGRGDARLTIIPEHALRFPSKDRALDFWKQQSTRRPTRPDGKPNRPLTAYTILVEPIPGEGADP